MGYETNPLMQKEIIKESFRLLQYTEKDVKLIKVIATNVPQGITYPKSWGRWGEKLAVCVFFLNGNYQKLKC